MDPEASPGVVPVEGSPVTDEETGTAFQAGLVREIDLFSLLAPLVAPCGAGKRAGPVRACLAYILVDSNMRFRIYLVAYNLKDFIDDHSSDLPPLTRSAMSSRTVTAPFSASRPMRPIFRFGVPSER